MATQLAMKGAKLMMHKEFKKNKDKPVAGDDVSPIPKPSARLQNLTPFFPGPLLHLRDQAQRQTQESRQTNPRLHPD